MKRKFGILSFFMAIFMIIGYLPNNSKADNKIDFQINLHGPSKIVDRFTLTVEGKNVKNQRQKVSKNSNINIKNPTEYYIGSFYNDYFQFGSMHTDDYKVGSKDEVRDYYLTDLNVYNKIVLDTPVVGSKEIKVYGVPETEFTSYVHNLKTYENSELKTGLINENGIGTISFDNALKNNEEVRVYNRGDFVYYDSISTKKTIRDLNLKVDIISAGDTEIKGRAKGNFALYIIDTVDEKSFRYSVKLNNNFTIPVKEIKETDIILARAYSEDLVTNINKLDIHNEESENITRLAGADRFLTSLEIANKLYPTTENIVIANGDISADALSAGPLANELNAPILLVKSNNMKEEIQDYIQKSGAENIYIIGGKSSVSDYIYNLLNKLGKKNIERIAGKDRYETSIEILKKLKKDFSYGNSIIITNGLEGKDVDALAAGPYARENKQGIVLTDGKNLRTYVSKELKDLNIKSAIIVGGKNTVADNVLSSTNINISNRIAGSNRQETSLEIAKKLNSPDTLIVANGYKSPDALTAISLSKVENAPIILTDGKILTNSQEKYIMDIKKKEEMEKIFIVGGKSSVSSNLYNKLDSIFK
ncbi:cell wall-binding repeat-containing protein [Miniphocaeibacter halophilus]|uniref:Cell wall-binding repeat-containing protein n=1 Tax=Miniphocaeibacter halophilus TaxID=2931922 RepID=A0AC61MRP4_9FIRM|nr:cell wall-binding repeat-containing protein [Miniphocaeibacter halophilus]QQK08215.1 cell wall-binding repeat-containing protein [Miniphocaeibacter halophilus]